MIQFVVIKKMSAGNESVGEMWDETKIFDETATLEDVMRWAGTRKQIIITLPENSKEEWAMKPIPGS